MKLSDNYYTGREVQQLLGITEPRLRTLITNNQIRKHYPPGRRTALYLKSEVNAFAEQWQAFLMAKDAPKTSFEIPTLEDMEDENELDRRAIGGAGMSAAVRKTWLTVNPKLDYHVRHNGKLVAFLRLLPIKHDVLEEFMEGKIRGKDIPAEAIETLEPGKSIECLVIGIAGDPDVSDSVRSHYMLTLIRGVQRELEKLGEEGIVLSKLYATSESATGIATALHLGMEQVPGKIGRRIKFEMDVKKSKSLLTKQYKQGLEKWKKQNTKK